MSTSNVPQWRVAHLAKTPPKSIVLHTINVMTQLHNALPTSKEARIQLALQAIKADANLSVQRAAQIYSVNRKTLANSRAGKQSRCDCAPNSANLRSTEKEVIVQHILNLDVQGFQPRLAAVKDMVDLLRKERGQPPVGVNWASTFVKHRHELKVNFNCKYDYKRALCEDPEAIRGWFRLVENKKAKYGILNEDTYNFDESGFMIGMISTGAVVTGSEH
jgi:hypothetical protein